MRDSEQVFWGKPEKRPLKRGPVKMEEIDTDSFDKLRTR